jgi:hypothetical protein
MDGQVNARQQEQSMLGTEALSSNANKKVRRQRRTIVPGSPRTSNGAFGGRPDWRHGASQGVEFRRFRPQNDEI